VKNLTRGLKVGTRWVALLPLIINLLVPSASSTAADPSPPTAVHHARVKYEKGHSLRFPDFDLTYVGKRHIKPSQYQRGWWVYDFTVRDRAGEQTVSWSAGTGDIGPTPFKVNGVEFQLELSHSEKLGTLGDDEMVVSPVKHP
jgi:hypothetical protein